MDLPDARPSAAAGEPLSAGGGRPSRGPWATTALVLALPYGVFFWLVPGLGELTLGNDYPEFSLRFQMELQYALEHGTFPLFCPGFLEGNTCAALAAGQLFHPLPYLARLLPGYWHGGALTNLTLLRLAQLGIAQLMLLRLLLRLRVGAIAAFVVSFVAVYNLRMLDMFRYGVALESYTAFVGLCAAVGLLWTERGLASRVLLVAAASLLAVSGHPQMAYYGFLGAAAVAGLVPWAAATLQGAPPPSRAEALRFYGAAAAFAAGGIALAAPFVLPFYFEYMAGNVSRVGQSYEFAAAYSDTWGGALGSWLGPLRADVHGAFGGSALLAAVLVAPAAWVAARRRARPFVVAWLLCAAVFLVSMGPATPLHLWFWKAFPLASAFRVPGRITMVLPVLGAIVLAWILHPEERELPPWRRPPVVTSALGAVLLVAFAAWGASRVPAPGPFAPGRIAPLPPWVEPAVLATGLLLLGALAVHGGLGRRRELAFAAGLLLCATTVVQTAIALRFGTWILPRVTTRTLAEMDAARRTAVGFQGPAGYGGETASVTRQVESSILDPALARFYRGWEAVSTLDAAREAMATRRDAHTVVVEDPARTSSPAPAILEPDRVTLAFNGFNLFRFRVQAGGRGYLTVSFPHFPNFAATVDGVRAQVLRANGYQVAVPVDAGDHLVELRFESPATTAGVALAGAAALALAWYLALRHLRGGAAWAVVAATAVAVVTLAALWRSRLWAGGNLGTRYEWTSLQLPPAGNVAFGRRTRMSSTIAADVNGYYSGRCVDGASGAPGCATEVEASPFWQVDLGAVTPIDRLTLHGRHPLLGTRSFPLVVAISRDGLTFEDVRIVTGTGFGASGVVDVGMSGYQARTLRLRGLGRGALWLDEVEVFPAPPR